MNQLSAMMGKSTNQRMRKITLFLVLITFSLLPLLVSFGIPIYMYVIGSICDSNIERFKIENAKCFGLVTSHNFIGAETTVYLELEDAGGFFKRAYAYDELGQP
ncbi:hypothetical protein M1N56_08280, partial [Dehalococcoidia bacterium]|nr:hypothetical protein [Dehalococcoidia bacterium]